jgi:hypothetical protein
MTIPASQNHNLEYAVDIVMCIDATASMAYILDHVKNSAISLHHRLATALAEKGKAISQLRLKVIAFRDFSDSTYDAIQETGFLLLPEQASEFESFVHALRPTGGGDNVPTYGLDALTLAVRSPWEMGLDRRRHVIVLFTDSPAHPLGYRGQVGTRDYPRLMHDPLAQWEVTQSQFAIMDNLAKRLLLFAPEESPWPEIADDWNNTLFFPSKSGDGLKEWEFDEIINTIANSL